MSRKTGKKRHTVLIVLAVLPAVPAIIALILMTHTQIIVGTIQKLSAGTVNTINSYEPLGDPIEGIKDVSTSLPRLSILKAIQTASWTLPTRMRTGKHQGPLLSTFMAADSLAAVRA